MGVWMINGQKVDFLETLLPGILAITLVMIYLGLFFLGLSTDAHFMATLKSIFNLVGGIDGVSAIASLLGVMVGVLTAVIAFVGVNTWRKQLIAPRQYQCVYEIRESLLLLKSQVSGMINRIYAYGYDHELTNEYLADGKQEDAVVENIIVSLRTIEKLKVFFDDHHSASISLLSNDMAKLVACISVLKTAINMKNESYVSYETLNNIDGDSVYSVEHEKGIEASQKRNSGVKQRVDTMF